MNSKYQPSAKLGIARSRNKPRQLTKMGCWSVCKHCEITDFRIGGGRTEHEVVRRLRGRGTHRPTSTTTIDRMIALLVWLYTWILHAACLLGCSIQFCKPKPTRSRRAQKNECAIHKSEICRSLLHRYHSVYGKRPNSTFKHVHLCGLLNISRAFSIPTECCVSARAGNPKAHLHMHQVTR